MKRKLTPREITLLAVLVVIALVSGYIMLWQRPTGDELERLKSETETGREVLSTMQTRLEKKKQMERELDELFAEDPEPVGMAEYDNMPQVMFELNSVLSAAQDYDLSFGTVNTSTSIVSRSISLRFTAESYSQAERILQSLHDSDYRCLLGDTVITVGESSTTVSTSITYFEYQ